MSKLQVVKTAVSKSAGRGGLLLKKHSPEILIGVGVVGVVASTVMACKATLKAQEVISEKNKNLSAIREAKELIGKKSYMSDPQGKPIEYTEHDYRKDLAVAYAQTGVEFIRLYGPAVLVGVVSIGCIVGAHGIMKRRNLALIAAYKAVEKSFSDYRKRVVDEFGEEKDRHFKNGVHAETITVTEVDENGKKTKVKRTVETVDPNGISQYARFFDESCSQWSNMSEYNLIFLKCQQNFANDLLQTRGHVFLNEVYDMLGIPRSQAGAVVGWVKGVGDDFIDFGIFDVDTKEYRNERVNDTISEERRDFVNGYKNSVLLDFNVSGVIYDLI